MNEVLPPLVVMGVSGCGKSTLGAMLAERLGLSFADGDDFHPAANKAKMADGTPLTDKDRIPWLTLIGKTLAAGDSGAASSPVIACSALKRSYRDLLRSHAPGLVFIHLAGGPDVISGRLAGRSHEYMPASLLQSQLATLEEPAEDESHIRVDILQGPTSLVEEILRKLHSAGRRDMDACCSGDARRWGPTN